VPYHSKNTFLTKVFDVFLFSEIVFNFFYKKKNERKEKKITTFRIILIKMALKCYNFGQIFL